MNDGKIFCEHTVRVKNKARLNILRIVLAAAYTLITLAYVVFFYLMLRQWQLLLLLPFIMYALISLTWRFTMPEYEYSVEAGVLTIAVIYGGRTRRVRFTAELSEATRISKCDRRALESRDIVSIKDLSVSGDGDSVWCAVFPDKSSGKKNAVIFETNEALQRALRLSNPSAMA